MIGIRLRRSGVPHLNGGVVVGVGGALGDATGVRLRVAPELALSRETFATLGWETDFRRLHVITPLLLLCTHPQAWTPSFGVGLGVPIQLRPRSRFGARILVDTFVHGFGVAASLDYFPGGSDEDDALRLTLLAQASF